MNLYLKEIRHHQLCEYVDNCAFYFKYSILCDVKLVSK